MARRSLRCLRVDAYASFLKRNKVAGVFINGSTGDFSSLSIEERNQLAAAWGSQRDSNFKVVNHIGHTNLKEAITMAEFSSEFVDAIATLSPYYFKPSSLEKLVFYCAEIAKSAA